MTSTAALPFAVRIASELDPVEMDMSYEFLSPSLYDHNLTPVSMQLLGHASSKVLPYPEQLWQQRRRPGAGQYQALPQGMLPR